MLGCCLGQQARRVLAGAAGARSDWPVCKTEPALSVAS